MIASKLYDIAEQLGWSHADLDLFLDYHRQFSLRKSVIEIPGANGTVEKIYPNWPLYHKLVDHVAGKPAVSEPKPQSADPFKEIDGREPLSDADLNAALTPKKRKLPPPPEVE